MTKTKSKISKREAINDLWKQGVITYKLHGGQKILQSTYEETKDDIITILCARRFGKSFWLCSVATALCASKPNQIVKYICPKQKMVKTIIKTIMRKILKDCPEDMRPEFKEADKIFLFPNGSEIQLAGTDNGNHESLRGGESNLCIVDEAGFCDDLKYVIQSVLAPTTDTTGGKIILASTPSKTSAHEFITEFVKPGLADNKIKVFTIDDNPMLTEAKKISIMNRFPLKDQDPGYLREYKCQIINDSTDLVVPGFDKIIDDVVGIHKRPPYFDWYVSGDIGFRDLTIFLFGYYDFLEATLVIEDELVVTGAENLITKVMAKKIQDKERELYSDPNSGELIKPALRVMDNDLKLINELQLLHDLTFLATEKTNKEVYINQLRMQLVQNQIKIHPKCKHLLYHIENACWDKHRKEFLRLPDTADFSIRGGHADGLDALIYMVRNVIKSKNPYPKGWNQLSGNNVYQSRFEKPGTELTETVKKMLNIRK